MNEIFILLLILAGLALMLVSLLRKRRPAQQKVYEIPDSWKETLLQKVPFYVKLKDADKKLFEQRIAHFLDTTRITPADTEIDDTDRLLIASGAIIPVFKFPAWEYHTLDEVIVYPNLFDQNFNTEGHGLSVSGMVGSGVMEGKMILSKKSLHLGFDNKTDKKNVAVHEFIHLIDKADGAIDGIPNALVDREFALPWIELMRQKIREIHKDDSDINRYGGTSFEEFFPVVSEYFFERPKLLKRKHPELYKQLEEIFIPQPQH
mgnify:CR=1 FL=1